MTPMPITTSWDDGHPTDFRIVELLAKYDLRGTFYIPKVAETETMGEAQIRRIASTQEVGAHTLNHVYLPEVDEATADREIVESRKWLESVLGDECRMFCFPRGKFTSHHLVTAAEAGYTGVRTTEMLSMQPPRRTHGIWEMPTTVEAYPHTSYTLMRNILKRRAGGNFLNLLRNRKQLDWPVLAQTLFDQTRSANGVFHLWGHSWEIEEFDLWGPLEATFKFIQENSVPSQRMTNAQVCDVMNAQEAASIPV